MKRRQLVIATAMAGCIYLSAPTAEAQAPLKIKPLAEKKVSELPAGPLYWRVETFESLTRAQAAAGPWGLAVESGGRIWLFRLGTASAASAGGEHRTTVGPIDPIGAPEYLLRINEASGPPGSITAEHTHPGSEAFFVLAGEQSIRTPHGVMRVRAGQSEAGQGADVPMQVSSSGAEPLHALVMFVVDANRPFSSPAKVDR